MSSAKARLSVVVDHGVAAVLDHDGLAVEALQPGQRLGEGGGLASQRCGVERRGLMSRTPSSRGRRRAVRSLVQIVACRLPGLQVDRRPSPRAPSRSTRSRSSPAPPSRQTQTPLIATSRSAGSNAASVVPTAARIRPQFGSSPWIAHLSRLLRATARADLDGVGLARPRRTTVIAMSCSAPSASRDQLPGEVGADVGARRRRSSSRVGCDAARAARPAAARCRWSTCSRRSRAGRR